MNARLIPHLLLATALVVGCEDDGPNIDVESSIPVRVEPVGRRPIAEYINATGTLRAAAEARLACLQTGSYQLQANPRTGVPFAMGDAVEEGELIVRFANPEFENQVSIDSKRLQNTVSQREYDKQKALFQKGGITLRELTDAERIAIDARYGFDNARLQLARLEVRVPFDGVLVDLPRFNHGQWLETGTALGQVMDYAELYAEISLPGVEIDRVHPGQEVLVTHYGSAAVDTLTGEVGQVSPVLDRDSRMFKATLVIANNSLRMRPGMFAKMDLVVASRDSALVISKDVVIDRGHAKIAFVVEKGIALERTLEIGLSNRLEIEVLSGLEAEERLVVEGFETLRNRSKVKIGK